MELSEKQAEELITMLAYMRVRPGVYIGGNTYKSLFSWWAGFIEGCRLFNFDVAEHIKTVFLKRGWKDSALGPIPSMRDRGLSEEEIVVEYITIIIQAIQMKTGIGNEPILKQHQHFRQFHNTEDYQRTREAIGKNSSENPKLDSKFLQLLDKIEADMQRNYDE